MRICLCWLVLVQLTGGTLFAQEVRAPAEKYNFEIAASSPADIMAAVDSTGKVSVWTKYAEHVGDRGELLSFSVEKYQVFERGRQIKITEDLKDIPRPGSTGVKRLLFSDGIEWMPSGGIERDKKIVFKGMKKIGFVRDGFVLGPFDYTVSWATPLGLDKAGNMHLVAECTKAKNDHVKSDEDLRVFQMLYKIDRRGRVIDEFVYDEAKYVERSGMGARYPWDWSKGSVGIDDSGQFYAVTIAPGAHAGRQNVIVERWTTKSAVD